VINPSTHNNNRQVAMHKALREQIKEWRSEEVAQEAERKRGPPSAAATAEALAAVGQWIDHRRHPVPQAEQQQQRRPRRQQARRRPQRSNPPVASARLRAGASAVEEDEEVEELAMDVGLLEEEAAAASDEGDLEAAMMEAATLSYQHKHGAFAVSRFVWVC
jgi:hypothetical protein